MNTKEFFTMKYAKEKSGASQYNPLKGNFAPKFKQDHKQARMNTLNHTTRVGLHTTHPKMLIPSQKGFKPRHDLEHRHIKTNK